MSLVFCQNVDLAQWTFRKLGNTQVMINANVKKVALNNII